MFVLAPFVLSLITSAHAADTYVVGIEANVAENNVMLLAAPKDLWFTGNGGGAISFESRRTGFMGSSSGLAFSTGWNNHGGLTFEGDWHMRRQLSRMVTLVADPVGLSVGSGMLSQNDEERFLFVTGGGVEIPVLKDVDASLVGKIGLGASHDNGHDWFMTNATSVHLGASYDF